jgi:hypothetical protein
MHNCCSRGRCLEEAYGHLERDATTGEIDEKRRFVAQLIHPDLGDNGLKPGALRVERVKHCRDPQQFVRRRVLNRRRQSKPAYAYELPL